MVVGEPGSTAQSVCGTRQRCCVIVYIFVPQGLADIPTTQMFLVSRAQGYQHVNFFFHSKENFKHNEGKEKSLEGKEFCKERMIFKNTSV